MPSLDDLKPFIVLGLALGGVFAMSGVGLVVLYRATGVLNLAYGAIGATGALISWSLLGGVNQWIAYSAGIAFGGAVTLLYGVVFGPPFAARDPLVKATATIGLLLILLGVMLWVWPPSTTRTYILPTRLWYYEVADVRVNWTQILGVIFPIVVTAGTAVFLRVTQGRHGDAGARQRPRDHGDARRPRAPGRGGGVARLRARLRDLRACSSATSSGSTSSASRSSSSRRWPRR